MAERFENTARLPPLRLGLLAAACVVAPIMCVWFWLAVDVLWGRLAVVSMAVIVVLVLYVFATEDPREVLIDGDRLEARIVQFGVVTQTISVRRQEVERLAFFDMRNREVAPGSTAVLRAFLTNGKRVTFGVLDARTVSAIATNARFRDAIRPLPPDRGGGESGR